MKRLILISVLLLLLIGSPASASNLDEGIDAYQKADYSTALRILKPLAEQKNAIAQFKLGVMYDKGLGVSENDKTAVNWYILAAEQGIAKAQNNLGLMYDKGQGVIKDPSFAHMWYNIAASLGNSNSDHNRDIIEKRMSSTQLEEATRLARECVKKNYKRCGEIKPWWKFWQ